MELLGTIIILVGFVGMACLLPVGWTLSHKLFKRLRTDHHATWVELGQPAFPGNASAATLWRTRKWLKTNHSQLGDPTFESWYSLQRKIQPIYMSFFALAIVGFLLLLTYGRT
jgi:hypothetical protein